MSILSIHNLSLSFGARDIFSGITVALPQDGKVGLVGPNGVGKTSLFRIIAGLAAPTSGQVHLVQGTRLGYLRQEAVEAFAGHEATVHDEMLAVFTPLREQGAYLQTMEARMAAGEATDELLAEYGTVLEAFEQAGGYEYERRIRQVLEGLGFPDSMWETPIGHLSGGQKTRALLARLLLEQPRLLILDEPTNHLDVQAIEWLETTLRAWDGTLLIASHDRFFLDKVVNRIWEMSPTHIEIYRGNYSSYVQQRQERWEQNQQLYTTTMERLEREMELIRRYIAWRKFDEADGKLKRLGRELVAIEELGILGAQGKKWSQMGVRSGQTFSVEETYRRLKAIKNPLARPPVLHMHLKPSRRSGQIVLRTEGLEIGYNGTPLFRTGPIHLERLERVGLIGPNGSGKTTFLRVIMNNLQPLHGTLQLGAGLKIGYFAQAHDGLNPDNTIFDELLRHRNLSPGEARNYLAQYLFRGDDVWKPVKALSGGERARLALGILALDGVNFLLLDEPTNHLDIPAQEVLQEGLERFDGTLLMVTHDRYLVDQLATQIWEMHDQRLTIFTGTYAEYLEAKEATVQLPPKVEVPTTSPSFRRQPSREKEERRRAQMLASLEEQIAQAERWLADFSQQMQNKGEHGDVAELTQLADSYATTQAQLDRLMEEWSALAAT